MYKTHNKRINKYAMKSPENMANVVLMVSQSIQQVWAGVGKQLADIEANGLNSAFLRNGTKRKLYLELQERKGELWPARLALSFPVYPRPRLCQGWLCLTALHG